jgi:signal transduction histidine kinase
MTRTTQALAKPDRRTDQDATAIAALAFDAVPTGLVAFDRRMQVILQNDAARRLLPDVTDVAECLAALAGDSSEDQWRAELRRIIEQKRPRRLDAAVPGQDGATDVVLQIDLLPLRAADDAPACGILCVEDITARATLERRLAVSERLAAVGKLAARVAHELNNPLDGVLRYINLALRRLEQVKGEAGASAESSDGSQGGAAGDPSVVKYLDNARAGLARMSEIIVGLLEFHRAAPPAFEQATINRIVEDAVTAMEGRAHDGRVSVVCSFHRPDTPVSRGSGVFQVCCNLIKNAIDAMPDGGTLTISTRIEGDAQTGLCVIRFEDTGVGLPENIDRIFEPFFTTKAPGKGTGLGLAVCRELLEKCGGSIEARRNNPRGAVMIVRLPLRDPGAAALAHRPAGPRKLSRTSAHRPTPSEESRHD